jgi:hypothetical protein
VGLPREVRERQPLGREHRERLLRRAAVLAAHLAGVRRPGLRAAGGSGHPGGADQGRGASGARPGLRRVARLRQEVPAHRAGPCGGAGGDPLVDRPPVPRQGWMEGALRAQPRDGRPVSGPAEFRHDAAAAEGGGSGPGTAAHSSTRERGHNRAHPEPPERAGPFGSAAPADLLGFPGPAGSLGLGGPVGSAGPADPFGPAGPAAPDGPVGPGGPFGSAGFLRSFDPDGPLDLGRSGRTRRLPRLCGPRRPRRSWRGRR